MNRAFFGPDKPLGTTLLSTSEQRPRAVERRLSERMVSLFGGMNALRIVLLFTLLPLGCGASIQAVYEADVRFEHCMALDARPDVKPTIRRECWSEWLTFYTYGQTRDRVRHARKRIRYLSGWPQPPAGASQGPASQGGAVPARLVSSAAVSEVDGGLTIGNTTIQGLGGHGPAATTFGSSGPDGTGGNSVVIEGSQRCLALCQGLRNVCQRECATAQCEKLCGANYRQCSRACR
jgi:hypothetical protein